MNADRINEVLARWAGVVPGSFLWEHYGHGSPANLPDFYHDLNAVRDVVQELPCGERRNSNWDKYVDHLQRITGADDCSGAQAILRCTEATAAQRCEALLRTLSLWEES